MRLLVFLSLAVCLVISACTKDQLEKDKEKIEKYLDDNGLIAESTDSGIYYIIEEEGTGTEHPNVNSEVTVYYTGYFLDGSFFDGTGGTPATFFLYETIKGWQQGIPLFKRGGKGKLFIPSELGYGSSNYGPIPGNSVLVFNIELVDF
ncbi:MAG: FKBP-type peptidyl-prolyl cis-trans isomerase [Saprospiraceae bacterium]|nr:FKBP-type peptidyl-prolyl cis-trans isomerase [Saprospiraceae bacterium]